MNPQHRAIIAAAIAEGVSPMEKDARLIVHDMVEATRTQMCRYEAGYNKMSEKQQDAVLGDLASAYRDTALIVARMIASADTPAVGMTCKDLKISNGTLTGIVKSNEKHFNDLISKVQDKGEVLIVLYEREYDDALDAIQSDKDQKSLPLDSGSDDDKPKTTRKQSDKPKAGGDVAKEIVLAPKLIEQAREFVKGQQNTSLAGLQNQFKIGADKARAVFAKLVESGDVTVAEGVDKWDLVRESASSESESLEEQEADAAPANDVLSVALYEQIKASVIKRNAVSVGVICIDNDVSEAIALAAIDEMEDDGVVTEEDELGGRGVVEQA